MINVEFKCSIFFPRYVRIKYFRPGEYQFMKWLDKHICSGPSIKGKTLLYSQKLIMIVIIMVFAKIYKRWVLCFSTTSQIIIFNLDTLKDYKKKIIFFEYFDLYTNFISDLKSNSIIIRFSYIKKQQCEQFHSKTT